ncbi:hypothetical protein [Parasitella parasitica]|uniref:Chalcone isomerase domain-containing protein n=1 Tax=Parasitella parasitica TaxID=35722 RepID=A0A0B7N900_9FUNG|nr:hypothetical protein [Parasitella parasitica]
MLRLSRSLYRSPKAFVSSRLVANRTLTTSISQNVGWKSNTSKIIGLTALGASLTAAGYLAFSSPAYSEAPAYAGTVEDPATNLVFPINLNTDNEWKRLIGLGVRAVTFLNMNVYVVGMYMKSEDIGELRKLDGWKNFDRSKFLQDTDLAEKFLDQPYELSIRLVPTRATNTQHLRDGFLRLLMQRMKDQEMTEDEEREVLKAIQEFKSNFVSMRVKKDTEFIFTKTREGGLKLVYEGRDFGTVQNPWLAKNFFMSYLNPNAPSSEAALYDIADGFERLMKEN